MHLTPFEIACGWVFDVDVQAPELPERLPDPFEALQRAIMPALLRPPCVVSFSGGLDSSLVLVAALEAARSEGLPSPIPVTLRFPHASESWEDQWQETVIRELGVSEWVRLTFDGELGVVGPVAKRVLERHGVLWPANSHLHVPIFDQAPGGAALTGYGGDHLLSGWPWRRQADVLSGRVRPVPRDLLRLGFASSPAFARRRRERTRVIDRPWLTPQATERARELEVEIALSRPRLWSSWLSWQAGTRRVRMAQASWRLLGAERDVVVCCPLLDPLFVASLAGIRAKLGLGDRRAIVDRVSAGRLPPSVVARPTKATFDDVLWCAPSREFASRCDGRGIDNELVRVEELRKIWCSPRPSLLTALLLQAEWLRAASTRAARPREA